MQFIPERQTAILARLDRDGRVVSAALAEELRVSVDSIRRDLHELEATGMLQRVHGGAVRAPASTPSYLERLEHEEPGREAVARRAAEAIADDQLIAIGGGTTALEWARALRRDLRATVLTSSPDVALALRTHATVTVDVLGGRLDRASQTVTGAGTVEQLRAVRPDLCVISPCWLDLDDGVTLRERAEAEVVQAMVERARRVMVVATTIKLGTTGPYQVADTEDVSVLVTDAKEHVIVEYMRLGIEVLTP